MIRKPQEEIQAQRLSIRAQEIIRGRQEPLRDSDMDYRKHNSPDVNRVKPNQAESKPVGRLNPNPQPNGKKAKTEEEERKLDLNRFRKDKEIKGRPSPEINPKQNIGRESDCQRDNQQNNQRDTLRDMQRPAEAPLRQNDNQWLSRTNPSNLEQGNARRQNERKQLQKSASAKAFESSKFASEQNEDYLRLHEKLNFIAGKIADMKRNVEHKREAKKKRVAEKQQRQEETKRQSKVDLKQLVTQMPENRDKQLHYCERNPYSPKHNVYYISEVMKAFWDDKSIAREHLLTSLHILKMLENSKYNSDQEMKEREVKLQRQPCDEGKKTVIFDLDETLIHCNDTLTPPYDVKLPIHFPTGEVIEAGINIRPYAIDILKNLARDFEIVVFTASHSCYANVVLDYLDPQNEYIRHRLYREHCYQTPEGMYCKDLRVIDRELSQMVLVDNAAYSYSAQLDNGIPILPYYHGKTDFELKALQNYLHSMLLVDDVRTINRKTFQLHKYRHYYNDAEKLVNELYTVQDTN